MVFCRFREKFYPYYGPEGTFCKVQFIRMDGNACTYIPIIISENDYEMFKKSLLSLVI